jgi:hypothetical protein
MTCFVSSLRSPLTALTVAAMLGGCGSNRGYGPALSYLIEVYVRVTGTGGGVVESTDPVVNIACTLIGGVVSGTCTDSFPEAGAGGSFRLVALPDPGSVVQSWTGCSEVSGASCTLNFSASAEDTTFRPTATFGPATPPPPGGTGWIQLGAAVSSPNEVEPDPSLLLDGSGRPVVAYRERLPGDVARIFVKRYEGGAWTQLGSAPINPNPNEAFSPSLAIDNSGTLWVAWSEYTTGVSQRIHVSRFTGSDWESTVPGDGAVDRLGAAAEQPALVISGGNVPILAWAQGGFVQVRSFISNQWVQPPVGFLTTTAYDVRLRLDRGIPVLAWVEGVGAANVINVARGSQNGSAFSTAVGPANAAPPAGTPSIRFFDVVVDQGTTYVIYAEGVTEFTVRARQLNGSSWADTGPGVVPLSGPQELMGLAVAPSRLVVAFSARGEVLDGSLFGASYYSPAGWNLLTDLVNLSRIDAPVGLSLAMATPTSPVVAGGVQVGENYELRVRQYLPQ